MSGTYFHSKGGDRQEPRRHVSGKTMMTQALLHSQNGTRGIELARRLGQVDGYTIAKALADEKALSAKIESLSKTNPEKSEMMRKAERVDKIANPLLLIPVGAAAGILGMTSPFAAFAVFGVGTLSLALASIWVLRIRTKYGSPDERGLEKAKKQLADAQEAKAELCAKAGLGGRLVELLQGLPLEASQKHTVLKQAIFQDSPEDYVVKAAGILEGVVARGEDLREFAERRLECLSRDISQARELERAGDGRASAGDSAQALGLYLQAAEILARVLDYSGAAGLYKKASDAVLAEKRKAAELSAKSGECYLKAGDRAAARERYEWAAMIVAETDPGISSDYQGRAATLI